MQEAKPLPDFTGTDDFFVSVTLNGLILDKAMLSVLNRISERGAELLSTEDFLVIDALYHERPLNDKMQSRLNRLIEMGIVEHIGRKKYVLARTSDRTTKLVLRSKNCSKFCQARVAVKYKNCCGNCAQPEK